MKPVSTFRLPEPSFRRMASNVETSGLTEISRLAETFDIPLAVAACHALELDLFPAPSAVLFWDLLGVSTGRRVSAATARLDRKYLNLVTEPPSGSVADRMISCLAFDLHRGASHAMDWFPGLSGYEPGDQIRVREDVAALGHRGWLTLDRPHGTFNYDRS